MRSPSFRTTGAREGGRGGLFARLPYPHARAHIPATRGAYLHAQPRHCELSCPQTQALHLGAPASCTSLHSALPHPSGRPALQSIPFTQTSNRTMQWGPRPPVLSRARRLQLLQPLHAQLLHLERHRRPGLAARTLNSASGPCPCPLRHYRRPHLAGMSLCHRLSELSSVPSPLAWIPLSSASPGLPPWHWPPHRNCCCLWHVPLPARAVRPTDPACSSAVPLASRPHVLEHFLMFFAWSPSYRPCHSGCPLRGPL